LTENTERINDAVGGSVNGIDALEEVLDITIKSFKMPVEFGTKRGERLIG
jgi:hypothetical protein